MFNDAQIRKLQNKVGKKVDANIKAREEKAKQIELERKKLISITKKLKNLKENF